jgi:hypothetical protein
MGVLADKDYVSNLRAALRCGAVLHGHAADRPALPAAALAAEIRKLSDVPVSAYAKITDALDAMLDDASEDCVLCAFGSLYQIAEIRTYFGRIGRYSGTSAQSDLSELTEYRLIRLSAAHDKTGASAINQPARSGGMDEKMNRTKKIVMLGLLNAWILCSRAFCPSRLRSRGSALVSCPSSWPRSSSARSMPVLPPRSGILSERSSFPARLFPRLYPFAFLTGLIFGLYLYNRPPRWWRAAAASATIGVICTVGLGTLWLSMLWDKGAVLLIPARLTQFAVMVPIQVIVITLLCYRSACGSAEKRKTRPPRAETERKEGNREGADCLNGEILTKSAALCRHLSPLLGIGCRVLD